MWHDTSVCLARLFSFCISCCCCTQVLQFVAGHVASLPAGLHCIQIGISQKIFKIGELSVTYRTEG